MIQPLALVLYEKLMPGSQLVNRLQDLHYRVQPLADAGQLVACAEAEGPMLVLADLESTGAEHLRGHRQPPATARHGAHPGHRVRARGCAPTPGCGAAGRGDFGRERCRPAESPATTPRSSVAVGVGRPDFAAQRRVCPGADSFWMNRKAAGKNATMIPEKTNT